MPLGTLRRQQAGSELGGCHFEELPECAGDFVTVGAVEFVRIGVDPNQNVALRMLFTEFDLIGREKERVRGWATGGLYLDVASASVDAERTNVEAR